tara:strand:- start:8663 stop:9193 length:531 start_codon:yes stop_codon:yes gene_type:complete
MQLKSLNGCRLKIGSYPPFSYNASGGGGEGRFLPSKENNILYLSFPPKTFSIPPLTSKTTKFLSIPLPLGFKIQIHMDKLEGTIDKNSGEVLFKFEARFIFSIGAMIKFPNLFVNTQLQTGEIKGKLHKSKGLVLQKNGKAKLVGISIIPETGNKILDTFLGLPNEALAELHCEIK